MQVGVVLLATGTFLGGLWAAYSWGRFWGWDPKEVWALIALLGYLAVLHARFAGWVKHRGLAALAVSCFALVIVAWYGVNFVLGAGLHSYGFGGGGKLFMGSLIGVQAFYVAAALWRSAQYCDARRQAAPATCRHARRRGGRNGRLHGSGLNLPLILPRARSCGARGNRYRRVPRRSSNDAQENAPRPAGPIRHGPRGTWRSSCRFRCA